MVITTIDQILKAILEMDIMKMIPMVEGMMEEEAATTMMKGDIMKLIMMIEVLLQ